MSNFELSLDWLSFTFPISPIYTSQEVMQTVLVSLGLAMPKLTTKDFHFTDGKPCINTVLKVLPKDKGWMGYTDSADIILEQASTAVVLGKLAWGGESQRNRAYVSLNATGSKLLDNKKISKTLIGLEAKITRIDIALDDFKGQYPVLMAVDAFKAGLFTTGGMTAKTPLLIDDLDSGNGKTFNIGNRKSKMMRIYEKGKQLKDKLSPWVRYEIEIHNTDRIIPLDVFLDLSGYFLGSSYGWVRDTFIDILKAIPRKISCMKKKTELVVQNFLDNFSKQYGKLFNFLEDAGMSVKTFAATIKRPGRPSRFTETHMDDFRRAVFISYSNGVSIC